MEKLTGQANVSTNCTKRIWLIVRVPLGGAFPLSRLDAWLRLAGSETKSDRNYPAS